jgi:cytochrome o ubiquinol oxidase subunit 2
LGKKSRWIFIGLLVLALFVVAAVYLKHSNLQVLNPKGALLSLVVVVPVFIMTFTIAWKYRASNTKAKYRPDFDKNLGAEIAWWGIPSVIILVLSIIAWNSSHTLDPYRTIAYKNTSPIDIQVIALDWKWLFIYPKQKIATINMLEFPVNTPLRFSITADAPMNSFWIPQLGGQIYAMPGMLTQMNLMASQIGDYRGSSANISGDGFAGMVFTARATTNANFDHWVTSAKGSSMKLNSMTYANLAKPTQYVPVSYYSLADSNLLNQVIDKYMSPNTASGSAMSMGANQ